MWQNPLMIKVVISLAPIHLEGLGRFIILLTSVAETGTLDRKSEVIEWEDITVNSSGTSIS
jgi:hypothetical protein